MKLTVKWVFDCSLLVLAAAAVGTFIYSSFSRNPRQAGGTDAARSPTARAFDRTVALGNSPMKGNRSARVAIVEFSEFQCPYCRAFATTVLPDLERDYVARGSVVVVFKHMPLESIHPYARGAAEVAQCAAATGRFWSVHDRLFRKPLDAQTADGVANELGNESCDRDRARKDVVDDLRLARELAITGTPTFLIGFMDGSDAIAVKERIDGVGTMVTFRQTLDALLK